MIGFYLHHHGSGHRTRGVAIARQLADPVTGLGSGGPPAGWPGAWVELPRDDQPPVDPAGADVSAHGVLHWAPRHHEGLLARHATLVGWLARARPAVLVVDVSVEVSLLARLCGIPVVVAAMPGERTDRAHRTAYDLADRLLAPWPAAAHGHDWPEAWRVKTWHVGGISRFSGRAPAAQVELGRVLVVWGSGGTQVTGDQLAAAAAATPQRRWVSVGGTRAAADDVALWEELGRAEVVVTHGGQNAVADVAAARRPAVVVTQERPHGEQRATAREVERLGLAVGLPRWPRAGQWSELLDRAKTIGGERWQDWGGEGAAGAAARLTALAERTSGEAVTG